MTPAPTASDMGRDFLPIAVDNYWIYDVVDMNWNFNEVDSSHYQFRERVDTVYEGADGAQTFRVVRSRRDDLRSPWHDDSTFAVVFTPQLVRTTLANRPTVELVFPIRDGQSWNPNIYNSLDSAELHYADFNQPLILPDGQGFAQTVRVEDAGQDNLFYLREAVSVYARGIGRVRRVRKSFQFCQFNDSLSTGCAIGIGYIVRGQERQESIVEYGVYP